MAVYNSLLPSRYKILYPTLHGTLNCSCECAETRPVSWLLTVSENWQHSLSPPSQRYHGTEPAAAETPATTTTPNLPFAFVACSLQRSGLALLNMICLWTLGLSQNMCSCCLSSKRWTEERFGQSGNVYFERFKFLLVRPTRRRISNRVMCSVL